MSVIVTENLSKLYGSRVGVERVDMTLEEGAVCGFLGPNGVGKTTTIRLLLGFLRPTRGSARIFGRDCWRDGARIRADVGYVPGDLRLPTWLTARRAIRMYGRLRRRDISEEGLALAEDFGLDLDVRVRNMSRGTRQKLGLVLALAPKPKLLVLDEPTSALDPVMQEKLKARLQGMARDGHTIFFSSHTLSEVDRVCERAIILKEGRIVADARVSELRARARRDVLIRWKNGCAPDEAPPFVKIRSRDAGTWRGSLEGSADELIAWLGAHSVEDLEIRPPDLEAVFASYYSNGEGAERSSTC